VSQKYTEGRTGGLGLPKAIQENISTIILALKGCIAGGILKTMIAADVFGSITDGKGGKKLVKDMVGYCSLTPAASKHKPMLMIETDDQVSVPVPHSDNVIVPTLILDFNSIVTPTNPQMRYRLSDPSNPVVTLFLKRCMLIPRLLIVGVIVCVCFASRSS
jgi:hypothetical protein